MPSLAAVVVAWRRYRQHGMKGAVAGQGFGDGLAADPIRERAGGVGHHGAGCLARVGQ